MGWTAHLLPSRHERRAPGPGRDPVHGGSLEGSLQARGVHPNEPVLVTIGNRPADLAAFLGVWLAGAVAAPIHVSAASTTFDAVRNATTARLLAEDRGPGDRVRCSAISQASPRRCPDHLHIRKHGPAKGVIIGHERMSGKLEVLDRLLRFQSNDTVIVPLQLTFIFGIWASLLALRSGSTLRLVPRFSAEVVAQSLENSGTVLAAVPSMLRTMLAGTSRMAPSLRTILTGERLLESHSPARLQRHSRLQAFMTFMG